MSRFTIKTRSEEGFALSPERKKGVRTAKLDEAGGIIELTRVFQ